MIHSETDPATYRFNLIIDDFRKLIDGEMFHLWIAQAFLRPKRFLAPMAVEPYQTLDGNLRRIYDALDQNQKLKFQRALSRATDENEKLWPPPEPVSRALAVQELLRLGLICRHYGVVSWAATQVTDLIKQPVTPADLITLCEIAAIIYDCSQWLPLAQRHGEYHPIFDSFNELFQKLGSRKSLSFFDAVLLPAAVRCNPNKWHLAACAAIRRYDSQGQGLFPDASQMFGRDDSPEGRGLYDLRACIARLAREELNILQYVSGIEALAASGQAGDRASITLLHILIELDMLTYLKGRTPTEFSLTDPEIRDAYIFFVGPKITGVANRALFRCMDALQIKNWYAESMTDLYQKSMNLAEATYQYVSSFAFANPIARMLVEAGTEGFDAEEGPDIFGRRDTEELDKYTKFGAFCMASAAAAATMSTNSHKGHHEYS